MLTLIYAGPVVMFIMGLVYLSAGVLHGSAAFAADGIVLMLAAPVILTSMLQLALWCHTGSKKSRAGGIRWIALAAVLLAGRFILPV